MLHDCATGCESFFFSIFLRQRSAVCIIASRYQSNFSDCVLKHAYCHHRMKPHCIFLIRLFQVSILCTSYAKHTHFNRFVSLFLISAQKLFPLHPTEKYIPEHQPRERPEQHVGKIQAFSLKSDNSNGRDKDIANDGGRTHCRAAVGHLGRGGAGAALLGGGGGVVAAHRGGDGRVID